MPLIHNDRLGRAVVRTGRILAYGAVVTALAAAIALAAALLFG